MTFISVSSRKYVAASSRVCSREEKNWNNQIFGVFVAFEERHIFPIETDTGYSKKKTVKNALYIRLSK